MRTFLFLILLLWQVSGHGQINYTNNPLSGFKIMNLPRGYMPVGALWNNAAGPMGPGAGPNEMLVSASINQLQLASDLQTKKNLELGILSFLKAGANTAAFNQAEVSLNGLSILTVNSPELLKRYLNQQVLYEAVKAGSFKITIDKQYLAAAKAGLTNLFQGKVNFDGQFETDEKVALDLSGADLYLAYRVIKVEKAKVEEKKLKFKSQSHGGSSSFTISSRYEAITPNITVQICPCSIIGCMLDAGVIQKEEYSQKMGACGAKEGYDLTVILKNELDMSTGLPLEKHFRIKAGSAIRNYNQPMYVKNTSEGLEVSYLSFEKIIYEVIARMNSTYLIRMLTGNNQKASLVTTRFKFSTVAPQAVPGW